MSLDPLYFAPFEIESHAFVAMAAFALGLIQLAAPKGTLPHKIMGWSWVVLMTVVAVSSLFINTICSFGPFSAIHLLTLITLVGLFMGVRHARRDNIKAHAQAMMSLFIGSLVIAGAFTFLPGRIMHDVAFGTHSTHERCWPQQAEADKTKAATAAS
jgi:uncharacterized membrane protein